MFCRVFGPVMEELAADEQEVNLMLMYSNQMGASWLRETEVLLRREFTTYFTLEGKKQENIDVSLRGSDVCVVHKGITFIVSFALNAVMPHDGGKFNLQSLDRYTTFEDVKDAQNLARLAWNPFLTQTEPALLRNSFSEIYSYLYNHGLKDEVKTAIMIFKRLQRCFAKEHHLKDHHILPASAVNILIACVDEEMGDLPRSAMDIVLHALKILRPLETFEPVYVDQQTLSKLINLPKAYATAPIAKSGSLVVRDPLFPWLNAVPPEVDLEHLGKFARTFCDKKCMESMGKHGTEVAHMPPGAPPGVGRDQSLFCPMPQRETTPRAPRHNTVRPPPQSSMYREAGSPPLEQPLPTHELQFTLRGQAEDMIIQYVQMKSSDRRGALFARLAEQHGHLIPFKKLGYVRLFDFVKDISCIKVSRHPHIELNIMNRTGEPNCLFVSEVNYPESGDRRRIVLRTNRKMQKKLKHQQDVMKRKTKLCARFTKTGCCFFGKDCWFIHAEPGAVSSI